MVPKTIGFSLEFANSYFKNSNRFISLKDKGFRARPMKANEFSHWYIKRNGKLFSVLSWKTLWQTSEKISL